MDGADRQRRPAIATFSGRCDREAPCKSRSWWRHCRHGPTRAPSGALGTNLHNAARDDYVRRDVTVARTRRGLVAGQIERESSGTGTRVASNHIGYFHER